MVTDTAAERPGARREGLLACHPLLFFFIISYAAPVSVDVTAMSWSSTERQEGIDVSTAA